MLRFMLQLSFPFVFNFRSVMSKVKNVHELSQLSKDRLEKILGNSNYAKLLWEFFHDAYEYDKPKK